MSDQPRARIVTRPTKDGRVEVFTQDPASGRENHTGLTVPAGQAGKTVEKLKETIQRSGSQVEVNENH